jgi:hypothetical protein
MRYQKELICTSMLALTLGAVPTSALAEPKLKQCDSVAAAEVLLASRFVSDNLQEILRPMVYLNEQQRVEFARKWPSMVLMCRDDKRTCARNTHLGFAHGGPGSLLTLCYYNHVDSHVEKKFCNLVDTLVHESGHANGYPSMAGHNKPTPAIRASDHIYRMGHDALQVCQRKLGSRNLPLPGSTQRAVGDTCTANDQCAGGLCQRDECTCRTDEDCGEGRRCKKGVLGIGANSCVTR